MIIIAVAGTSQNSGVKDYNVFHISKAAKGEGEEPKEQRQTKPSSLTLPARPWAWTCILSVGHLRADGKYYLFCRAAQQWGLGTGRMGCTGSSTTISFCFLRHVEKPLSIRHPSIWTTEGLWSWSLSFYSIQLHIQILDHTWCVRIFNVDLSQLYLSLLLFMGNRKKLVSLLSKLVHCLSFITLCKHHFSSYWGTESWAHFVCFPFLFIPRSIQCAPAICQTNKDSCPHDTYFINM